ncbi:MAG: DUF5675 family protein [Prevotellaceae bacterium]|jgi:hypothetical protein|nr:DUF5675 family protein [Prevotellaceae bacterium]
MELILKRRFLKAEYTIGALYIDGEYFCDTLEATDRGLSQSMPLGEIRRRKAAHKTAIPTGMYWVIVTRSPTKKRLLPLLLNVPGFSGILIHRSNSPHDTSGCILAGENREKGKVINTARYEKRLVKMLTEAQDREEEISIMIN